MYHHTTTEHISHNDNNNNNSNNQSSYHYQTAKGVGIFEFIFPALFFFNGDNRDSHQKRYMI